MAKKSPPPTRGTSPNSQPEKADTVYSWDPVSCAVDRFLAYLDVMIVARNRYLYPSHWEHRRGVLETLNQDFFAVTDRLFPFGPSVQPGILQSNPDVVMAELADLAIAELARPGTTPHVQVIKRVQQWLSDYETCGRLLGPIDMEDLKQQQAHIQVGASVRGELLTTLAVHSRVIPTEIRNRNRFFTVSFSTTTGRVAPTNEELFAWLTTRIPQPNSSRRHPVGATGTDEPNICDLSPALRDALQHYRDAVAANGSEASLNSLFDWCRSEDRDMSRWKDWESWNKTLNRAFDALGLPRHSARAGTAPRSAVPSSHFNTRND